MRGHSIDKVSCRENLSLEEFWNIGGENEGPCHF